MAKSAKAKPVIEVAPEVISDGAPKKPFESLQPLVGMPTFTDSDKEEAITLLTLLVDSIDRMDNIDMYHEANKAREFITRKRL